jgi:hypothetical protein
LLSELAWVADLGELDVLLAVGWAALSVVLWVDLLGLLDLTLAASMAV